VTLPPDDFRTALARWASGVTIVAVRTDDRIVATTVSAFTSLSLEPPLVLLALGANATILPFLQPAARFGISLLAESQRRLATIYADPFPVGPDPFPAEGIPVLPGALASLHCVVSETRQGGDHVIVIAAVEHAEAADGAPLLRFDRRYHGLRD
jgi:flavin reductase (DIM6/NTAB) family NADH-FMN oxidoreductase RutF